MSMRLAVLTVFASLAPLFAHAQSAQYEDCVALAATDANAAREKAAQWEAIGGGPEARHCGAIALIGLGAERDAAKILTELGVEANSMALPDRSAALSLAGDLWLRNNQEEIAREAYLRASQLAPNDRAPLIGAAKAAAAIEDWNASRDSLTRALELNPADAEALTLRAAAHRRMGEVSMALDDAVKATRLAPEAAIAWFERGAAERAMGSKAAAQEAWLRAAILDPDGPAGELARLNLQRLATE
ncbi:MAG: hypothetical protein ACFB0F_11080 [Neomegalonema sp.]